MSWDNKVVWSEGMFLRPQHFQQHDRYLENYRFATRAWNATTGAFRTWSSIRPCCP